MKIQLNGQVRDLPAPPEEPLLWVIRDRAGLTGTKYGCGIGQCGACTVHLDGAPVRSCITPAAAAAGRAVRTVEGLAAPDGRLHALQQAWVRWQVPQCGYCQSGMLMAAAGLLARHREPSDAQIDEAITNLCRCGTYPRVRAAIHDAARAMNTTGSGHGPAA